MFDELEPKDFLIAGVVAYISAVVFFGSLLGAILIR